MKTSALVLAGALISFLSSCRSDVEPVQVVQAHLSATAPTPTFHQCPSVGLNYGCAILIWVTDDGFQVIEDGRQGPFDGGDDTLVGIQNDSHKVIDTIRLHGTQPIFGFEGDGLCDTDPRPAG